MRVAVLLLRFHTAHPTVTSATFESYATIARMTRTPYSTTRTICMTALTKSVPRTR